MIGPTYRVPNLLTCVKIQKIVSGIECMYTLLENFEKMANELLSTNIDGLFEKMNLDETQKVLRRMRQEVEKKREELRITVG